MMGTSDDENQTSLDGSETRNGDNKCSSSDDPDEDNISTNEQQESSNIKCEGDDAPLKEPSQPLDALLESLPPDDRQKFNVANKRRKDDDMKTMAAHAHLVEMRGEFNRVKFELESAQKAYDKSKDLSQEHSEQDADNLLLESTEWNSRYLQLKAYFDREGHSHLKRNISDAEVESMSEAEAAELRALSRWACRQRKFKRGGELEHYKLLLLNRLNFDWDPKTGHGPEKWLKNFNLLKDFKEAHGHVDVPMQYGENKLGLWVKTQLTLYRNGKEGKLPALSMDRIGMLEDLGITWGERRKGVPWEDRFQALLDYKKRYGHVHVPWQWKENVGLAQWVNTQRKKFKDLQDGKKNNLNGNQIELLTGIGFKWNTGGKGRYSVEDQSNEKPSKKARRITAASISEQPTFPEDSKMMGTKVTPPATAASFAVLNHAEAAASKASMMAVNLQQAGFSQANNVMSNANAQNPQATNYLGSLYNGSLDANQSLNGLGGTTPQVMCTVPPALCGADQLSQALSGATEQQFSLNSMLGGMTSQQVTSNPTQALQQSNDTASSLSAQTQALQQLLNQQLNQPSNDLTSVAQQQSSTQTLQQFLNNQQAFQPQSSPINDTGPSALSQAYQQILNQQMNPAPVSIIGAPQQQQTSQDNNTNNNLSVLTNTFQQYFNQQPQNNGLGTFSSQAPSTTQNDSTSNQVNIYQQLLNQQMNQSSTTNSMFDHQNKNNNWCS